MTRNRNLNYGNSIFKQLYYSIFPALSQDLSVLGIKSEKALPEERANGIRRQDTWGRTLFVNFSALSKKE